MIENIVLIAKGHWVIVIIATILIRLITNLFKGGLHHVPGPLIRKISTLPRILSVYNNRSHEDDISLHKRYGKIVRLAPNLVSIADPAEINQLYGIGTAFVKSEFYSLSSAYDDEGMLPDTFIMTDKTLHTRMKRNASNAYSVAGIMQVEACIEPVNARLLDHIAKQAGRPIDISDTLRDYAMDAVISLTLGRDFNYIEKGDTLNMYHVFETVAGYMAIFGQIPWVHRFLLARPWVARLLLGDGSGDKEVIDLALSEIKIAKQNPSEDGPVTFLQRLLMNQAKEPSSINDREIMTHIFGNIAAGSDTTAIALRAIIYHVLKNPAVYKQLYEEVRSLSMPVQFAKANQLPYLNAVIQEAIRMHPSVGMLLERVVPAAGANIGDYKMKAGSKIGINPWVLHRDPSVFPEPDTFIPERWLSDITDEGHLKLMSRSFLAFGYGAHTCSGRWISLMEIKKVIPSLLITFNMSLAEEEKYALNNRWFTAQTGLIVKFDRRTG